MPRALLLSLLGLCSLARADNLLLNSSFELGRGDYAEGWSVRNGGLRVSRVPAPTHSGQWALRFEVPDDLEVNWYQVGQELPAPGREVAVTMSAFVRGESLRDGHGAYLSINFFDGAGHRTGHFDSAPVRGTTDWQRLTTTAKAPAGSSTMVAILLLHGHGAAVFDDVQLEPGERAGAYQVSAHDTARLERLRRFEAEATRRLGELGYQRRPGRNVALLTERLNGRGTATPPADIAATLTAAGWSVAALTADDLANPALLTPARFDLLILPGGEAFPAPAHEALVAYLSGGGSYLSLGGYAFDQPLVKVADRWYPSDALPPAKPTFTHSIDEFATTRPVQREGADAHALEVGVRAVPGADGLALRLATPSLRGWATTRFAVATDRLPAGWSTTRLRARGDRNGIGLIVEWTERDQSRWQKVLRLTTEWQEFVIPARDLKYWQDNPSTGRGGGDDHFQPANAAAMLFGFSVATEADGSAPGVDLDWLRVEDDPLAALRGPAPRINTRYGAIRDAMWPSEEQIGACDPSHPLLDVVGARAAADQRVLPADLELTGRWTGVAATCVLGLGGHGFSANRCRLIPLLATHDAAGRPRGAALSLVYHYDGLFKGSAWAFCGVDNVDLFGAGRPLNSHLPTLAQALVTKRFLHEADAEYACYRPGESMTVRCSVSALDAPDRELSVRLLADGREVSAKPVKLAGGTTQRLTWSVPVGGARPFVPLRFELLANGQVIDALDNGVVVWRDEDVRRGPAVGVQDATLTFRGKPRFLVGSQLWWGQVGTVTARSPLQFKRDYEQMKSLGFHIQRSFLRMDTEQQRRISDAMVVLGALNDVVLYHTPNWEPHPGEADAKRWPAEARKLAERYRGVPHVVIDLCNEPAVKTEVAGLVPLWNEWLRRRYGTDTALRAAWAGRGPAGAIGAIPLPKRSDDWADGPTADVYRFLVDDNRQWSRELRAAMRAADPQRLISVGFLPGHGWGPDFLVVPHEGSFDLDFSDRHFYGRIADFPAENAFIDLRLLGKPTSIGEFGARNHPGFGDQYEDTATYDHRHELVVAHAFGMGGSFANTWHWRDPMEGIFPFGQVHADNVPRSVAGKLSRMAREFGAVDRRPTLPKLAVLLPTEHLLGGQRPRVVAAVSRAIDTLLGLQAPFACLADASLAQLPAAVQQIIAPLPYVLSDAAYGHLRAFVERGGQLIVTGDLRYNSQRQVAAGERLRQLCGVTAGVAAPPLDLRGAATSCQVAGWPAFRAHAVGPVSAAAATALGSLVFEHRLGAGRVLYVAAPLELESTEDVPLRAVYAALLARVGAERLGVQPDDPSLHVFRIELVDGGRRYLVWNEGPARPVTVADPAGRRTATAPARSWLLL